jgi:hypothetical protein
MNNQPFKQASKNRTTMTATATTVTMYINTGYMNEPQTKEIMAPTVRIVKGILGDMCMPNHVLQPPKFVSLEFVKWTPPSDNNDDDNDEDDAATCIYTMRLTVAIQRVDFNTAQTIVDTLGDAIYENGAMFPFTIAAEYRQKHHTFLYPPNSLLDTRPIRTTTATIRLNMGYMDGTQENIITVEHARANQDIITQHVTDCIPDPDDLDLDDTVQQIKFVSLEFVQWTPPEDETVWAHDDCVDSDPAARVTYTMQLTVAIHHEHPVAFNTAQSIVDAIYENGAMFPSTLTIAEDREISHTFLYPYHSNFSGLENGLCLGE